MLISIAQILISIERSARYELVLVPVDGHTVLGYRPSAAVAGGKRAAWAAGDKVDSLVWQDAAADDDRAGGHLPLNLCTHSTSHSTDASAYISTTSWMQQSGVYRRQTACRLIVVSGELAALSSLVQHRCRSTAMPLRSLPGDQNGDIRCSGAPQLA